VRKTAASAAVFYCACLISIVSSHPNSDLSSLGFFPPEVRGRQAEFSLCLMLVRRIKYAGAMHKKMTISLVETVHEALYRTIGKRLNTPQYSLARLIACAGNQKLVQAIPAPQFPLPRAKQILKRYGQRPEYPCAGDTAWRIVSGFPCAPQLP
jgi:hypothetical protein